ncbi:MAG: hypothetical protein Q4C38_02150 [bacterium]|nr:hypothetical protein [bacterium]
MFDTEKLDDALYKSIYGITRVGDYNEIWSRIKSNPEVLREAVQVKRDKFDEHDIVKGLTICDSMLIDYNSVDEVAYNNLINSIYTNTDIARIVINGASNGGYSFLLMSLWNHNLKLTEEQKNFAVNEAMNKIGTTRWQQSEEDFSKKLDDMGISDNNTTFINIDGCINPIGQKSSSQYMNYMFFILSQTQVHGTGEFDIRYYILRNPNWSLDEKQKLIMDFWCDDETYDEYLEQWEWEIINDSANFKDNHVFQLEKFDLYEYSYETLLKIYGDKETTDRIWSKIQFCKQMHKLRPQQWELEFTPKKKVLVQTDIKN